MTESNPYLATARALAADDVRLSLQTALDKQPDQEAELQGLARQYRLPVDAVRQDGAEVARRAKLDAVDYPDLVKNSPATAAFLADPRRAAIAHDDIGNLGALERALQFGKNSGKALLSGVYGFAEGVAGQAEAGADLLSKYVTAPLAGTVLPADIGAPVAEALRGVRRNQGAWRDYLTPAGAGNVESGYYAGLQSLTQNLLTLPLAAGGNPQTALNAMALNTGGQSFGRARDLGVDAPRSLLYGAADAAIEYGTEKLPLHLLFKDLKAGAPLFKLLTAQLAAEIPGEQAATALQDLNEWSMLHPDRTLPDYLAERPDAAVQTLVATLVGSGGQTGLLHGADALLRRNRDSAAAAETQYENLRNLHDLAAASKVLPRDPQAMQDFVEQAAAAGPVRHVYIDARAFAQSDVAAEAAAVPEVAEQLPEALAAGGEIAIPLADYVTKIAPNPFAERLAEHIRLEGEDFSRAEAVSYLGDQAEHLQAEIEHGLRMAEQERAFSQSERIVREALRRELTDNAPFAGRANDHYAMLLSQFYATQAKRFGVLPGDLYREYRLRVKVDGQRRKKRPLPFLPESDYAAATPEPSEPAFDWQGKPVKPAAVFGPASSTETASVPRDDVRTGAQPAMANDADFDTGDLGANNSIEARASTAGPVLSGLYDDVQQEESPGRGSYNPVNRTITLHDSADLSTLLHEAAHFFLEVQFDLTQRLLNAEHGGGTEPGTFSQRGRPPKAGKSAGEAAAGESNPAAAQTVHPTAKFTEEYLDKHLRRDDAPPGDYAGRTKLVVETTRLLGTDKVKTPADAAQAMAYLAQYAMERFEALLTDERGKPLAIIGSFKGTPSETSAWPETLTREAFRVKGAAKIWFAHNHPGGPNHLSYDDRLVNRELNEAFRGSGIEPQGFLAIGVRGKTGRAWTFEPSAPKSDRPKKGPDYQPGDVRGFTKPPKTSVVMPVLELAHADEDALNNFPMLSTYSAVKYAKGRSGVLLLSGDSLPNAYLPLTSAEMIELRSQGRLDGMYRALSISNAVEAVIVNYGDMSKQAVSNLAGFFTGMNIHLSDIIDVGRDGPASRVRHGTMLSNIHGFFQRDPDATPDGPPPGGEEHQGSRLRFGADGRQQIIEDTQALLDWFGVKDLREWQAMDLEQQRPYHEQFAEGFEAYLFEGKAPSLALQSIFERFRAWLSRIYRSISALHAHLNDEVRGVFDRMLASEDEISLAEQARGMRPLFAGAGEAGMDAADYAAYRALAHAAANSAANALQNQALADMQWLRGAQHKLLRRVQQRRDGLRGAVRRVVADEVMSQQVYMAWELLTKKSSDVRLEKRQLLAMNLPRGTLEKLWKRGMVTNSRNWPIPMVAQWYDFYTGGHLIRVLANAEDPKHLIRRLTDQIMLEKYGELSSPQAIERQAALAMHRGLRGELLAREAAALADMAGESRFPNDALAGRAETMIRNKRLRDINSGPYQRAEARAAREALQAWQAGDINRAAIAKRRQLLNFHAAAAALHVEEELKAGWTRLEDFFELYFQMPYEIKDLIGNWLTRLGFNDEYARRELTRFGFKDRRQTIDEPMLLSKADRRVESERNYQKDLLALLASLKRQGLEPELPAKLIYGSYRSYLDLTANDFKTLLDTVKLFEYLARRKNLLLAGGGKHEFKDAENRMKIGMKKHAGGEHPPTAGARAGFLDGSVAAAKAGYWALRMDGGRAGGPVSAYLIRPARRAAAVEREFRALAARGLSALLAPVLPGDSNAGTRFFSSIARELTPETRLVIALNTGNEGNLRRLLLGEGWTYRQIQPVLASLSAEEWRAVQGIWDYFAGLRPGVEALQRRVYGAVRDWLPRKPRPQTAVNAGGETVYLALRGGYYPLRHAPLHAPNPRVEPLSEATRQTFFTPYDPPLDTRPLLYSLSGLFSGLNEIIHDLVWHETLIDFNKFVHSEPLLKRGRQYYGNRPFVDIAVWVREIRQGDKALNHGNEAALAEFRRGGPAALLGFEALWLALEGRRIAQCFATQGLTPMARAIASLLADRREIGWLVNKKSLSMNERRRTFFKTLHDLRGLNGGDYLAAIMALQAGRLHDVLIWLALYQQTQADGEDEAEAVRQADQAVTTAPAAPYEELVADPRLLAACRLSYSHIETGMSHGMGRDSAENQPYRRLAGYVLEAPLPLLLGKALRVALLAGGGDADDWQGVAPRAVDSGLGGQLPLLMALREIEAGMAGLDGGEHLPGVVVEAKLGAAGDDFQKQFWPAAIAAAEEMLDREPED